MRLQEHRGGCCECMRRALHKMEGQSIRVFKSDRRVQREMTWVWLDEVYGVWIECNEDSYTTNTPLKGLPRDRHQKRLIKQSPKQYDLLKLISNKNSVVLLFIHPHTHYTCLTSALRVTVWWETQRNLPSWMWPNRWYFGFTLLCTVLSSSTHPARTPVQQRSPCPTGGEWVIRMSVSLGIASHFSRHCLPLGKLNAQLQNTGCLCMKEKSHVKKTPANFSLLFSLSTFLHLLPVH